MLIRHKKNFIFTKTVKTDSTSVESYFEQWCMPDGKRRQSERLRDYVRNTGIIGKRSGHPGDTTWYDHMSAYNIRKHLGRDVWDEYFKFAVVRNPFDKLISGYSMFQKFQPFVKGLRRIHVYGTQLLGKYNPLSNHIHEAVIRQFRKWLQLLHELILKSKSLIDAVEVPHYSKPIELSLVHRDKYIIEGEEYIDFFIQYESLNKGIKHVCDNLHLPFEIQRIPRFKKGKRRPRGVPIQAYYDQKGQALVQEIYA